MSLELSYRMGDEHGPEVARAHVFKQPDGSYGASGIPDPKSVRIDDTLYVVEGWINAPWG